jgi:hypothetical protein
MYTYMERERAREKKVGRRGYNMYTERDRETEREKESEEEREGGREVVTERRL